MTGIISRATTERIWRAHHDIDIGEKLLADINEKLRNGDDASPIGPFGRRGSYTLGMPMTENSQRILNVSPRLTRAIIEADIAEKRRELVEACLAARVELETADLGSALS